MTQVSTYYADNNKGKAVVSFEKDRYVIDYYDDHGVHFFREDNFEDKSIHFVEDAAENWALGIKHLEDVE